MNSLPPNLPKTPQNLLAFRDSPAQRNHQKYRNQKITDPDGTTFDSKAEHKFWHHLKLRERAGEVFNLERQIVYVLAPSVTIAGRKRPPLRYIADMRWNEGSPTGKLVVADVKGAVCDSYRIKRHLMAFVHNIEIQEIRA